MTMTTALRSRRTVAAPLAVVLGCLAAAVASTETRAPASPGASPAPSPHAEHAAASAPAAGAPGKAASAPATSAPDWFEGGGGLFAPPYFDTFTGIDLAPLSASQREAFIHWVNTEYCSCNQTGCSRDTIAHCYVNDPRCPRAPARIREILAAVQRGDPVPGSRRERAGG